MPVGAASLHYAFEGEVWFYNNPNAVYFVSLPSEVSAEILELVGTALNPWGTVPVDVTIGDFTWESSMFPRKERNCYDLPLREKVRQRVGIKAGDMISVTIEIPFPG